MVTALRQFVLCCLYLLSPTAANPDIFRLFFRYGFEDGQIGDPNGRPTEEDIKGLMCATNKFMTESLENYTKQAGVEIIATEIDWGFEDWIYNGSEPEAPRNVPVIVNFTATTVGATTPTNDELWEATKYFDYFSYIMDYIWTIPGQNFFKETRGLWYEPIIMPPVTTAQMPENSECPVPPGGQRATTLSPTSAPSQLQRATTLMPTTPTMAPTQLQRATTLMPTDPMRAATLAPTTAAEEMVYFTIQIDFFAGKEAEPGQNDIEKMMCKTNEFFLKTLKEKVSSDIEVYSTNIDWEWDPKAALPSVIEFFANATYADGSHVAAIDVFEAMEQVDVKAFVQDYVWQAEVYKENIFYQTEDIFFAGSYTGSPTPPAPHVGKLAKVPNC